MRDNVYPLPGLKKPPFPTAKVIPITEHSKPNQCFTGTRDQWEEAIFRCAHHFNVFRLHRRLGPRPVERETRVYATFPEALADAGQDVQVLIYAVTLEGDNFCLPHNKYDFYTQIWEER